MKDAHLEGTLTVVLNRVFAGPHAATLLGTGSRWAEPFLWLHFDMTNSFAHSLAVAAHALPANRLGFGTDLPRVALEDLVRSVEVVVQRSLPERGREAICGTALASFFAL